MVKKIFTAIAALLLPACVLAQEDPIQRHGNHLSIVAPQATPGSLKLVEPGTNAIELWVNGAGQVKLTDGVLAPVTTNDVDLGSSSLKFKDLYLQGTQTSTGDITTSGDVSLLATGKTIEFETGTAASACMGTGTFNGTTAVTVSTTCATTTSYIFFSPTSDGTGTSTNDQSGCWTTNIVNGTSFDADCSDAAMSSTFNWVIFHEAP